MKNFLIAVSICLLTLNQLLAQPTINLTKTLGGASVDIIKDLLTDNDGHIIALCRADSFDGDVNCTLHGKNDVWLVKMDVSGNILKQQCYGGSEDEDPYQIMKTNDGGWIFTCNTFSNNGDVSGNHGSQDIWVVKLDTSWNIQWQRCIGGSGGEYVDNSIQLSDGKYAITCETTSYDGDFPDHLGTIFSTDAWIVLLNPDGSKDTALIYGGSEDDYIKDILELPNKDWMLFGYTYSTDFDLAGTTSFGYADGWVFRTDSLGLIKWTKRIGGEAPDGLASATLIANGSFLTAGTTGSDSGVFNGNHGGGGDLWVMKLDSSGNLVHNYTYGGSGGDGASYRMKFYSVLNFGFAICAVSYSPDGNVGLNYGYSDFWLVNVDTSGQLINSKVTGGSFYDNPYTNTVLDSNNVYMGGQTFSDDYDIQDYKGEGDGWLVGFNEYNLVATINGCDSVIIFPNPLNDQFIISRSSGNLEGALHIYSITGELVFKSAIHQNEQLISIGQLPKGNYLYALFDVEGKLVAKGKLITQ